MTHFVLWMHILLAILTFSVVCIAALQAVLLHLQDRVLHRPGRASAIIKKLPPLETMERLLFRTVILGFLLLTAMLISSISFFPHIFQLPLLKKTLLVIFTWSVFAMLLLGRYAFGWRGRKAVYYTLAGFVLLVVIVFPLSF